MGNQKYSPTSISLNVDFIFVSANYQYRKGSPILIRQRNGQQGFEYIQQVSFHNQSYLQNILQVLNFRKAMNVRNIVAVKSFQIGQANYSFPVQKLMQNKHQRGPNNTVIQSLRKGKIYRVITDWICLTLNQFKLHLFTQVFTIICGIISAMKILVNYYGYFKLTERMVGLDKLGNVKVWVNQDFSKNQVQNITKNQINANFSEEQSIKNIILVIKNCVALNSKSTIQSQLFGKLSTMNTYSEVIFELNNFKDRLDVGMQLLNRNSLYQRVKGQIYTSKCKFQENINSRQSVPCFSLINHNLPHLNLSNQSKHSSIQIDHQFCLENTNIKKKHKYLQQSFINTSLNTSIGARANHCGQLKHDPKFSPKVPSKSIFSNSDCKSKSSDSNSFYKPSKQKVKEIQGNRIKLRNKFNNIINPKSTNYQCLRNTYSCSKSFRNINNQRQNKFIQFQSWKQQSYSFHKNSHCLTPEHLSSSHFSPKKFNLTFQNHLLTREEQLSQKRQDNLNRQVPSFLKNKIKKNQAQKKNQFPSFKKTAYTQIKKSIPSFISDQFSVTKQHPLLKDYTILTSIRDSRDQTSKNEHKLHSRFQSFGGQKVINFQPILQQSLTKTMGKRVQIVEDLEQTFKFEGQADIKICGLQSCESRYLSSKRQLNSHKILQKQQENNQANLKQKKIDKSQTPISKKSNKRKSDDISTRQNIKLIQAKKQFERFKSHRKLDRYAQADEVKDQTGVSQWEQEYNLPERINTQQFLCVQPQAQFQLNQVNLDDYCNRKLTTVEAQYESLFLSAQQQQPVYNKNKRISIEDFKTHLKKLQNLHEDIIISNQVQSFEQIPKGGQINFKNRIKHEQSIKQIIEKQNQQKYVQQEPIIYSFKITPNQSLFSQKNQLNVTYQKNIQCESSNTKTQQKSFKTHNGFRNLSTKDNLCKGQHKQKLFEDFLAQNSFLRSTIQNPKNFCIKEQFLRHKSSKDLLHQKNLTEFSKNKSKRNFSDLLEQKNRKSLLQENTIVEKTFKNPKDQYSNLVGLLLKDHQLQTIQETQRDAYSNYEDARLTIRESFLPQIFMHTPTFGVNHDY